MACTAGPLGTAGLVATAAAGATPLLAEARASAAEQAVAPQAGGTGGGGDPEARVGWAGRALQGGPEPRAGEEALEAPRKAVPYSI